jgi:hypothetical protein
MFDIHDQFAEGEKSEFFAVPPAIKNKISSGAVMTSWNYYLMS